MGRLSVRRRPGLYRNGFKRLFDILAILLAAPVMLPLVLVLVLLVACTGGHPFYRQARVGRGGRIYTMWKLRTMQVGAEEALADHLAADPTARAEWNTTQKLRNDPRITRLGGFLRKSSLDELPQLWNVVRGDMSLVGPRPLLPQYLERYTPRQMRRHEVPPGITGLAQVEGRNALTWEERFELDVRYVEQRSLALDARILLRTVAAVLARRGVSAAGHATMPEFLGSTDAVAARRLAVRAE